MSFVVPKYSKNQINHAGKILANQSGDSDKDWVFADRVLANWRAAHGYPINTFQATLRNRLKSIDSKAMLRKDLSD
jgi:hypothetical protein